MRSENPAWNNINNTDFLFMQIYSSSSIEIWNSEKYKKVIQIK